MRTLTLTEAAAFLKMHQEEVRMRAKRGLLPGAKTGKRWVFLEEDLIAYVRSLYALSRQALRVTPLNEKESVCHYASEERSGGSTSPPPTGNVYADLLKPKLKPKRKNFTTG